MDLYSLAIAFCAASAISTITSKSEIPMVPAPAPEYTQKNEQKKINHASAQDYFPNI
jgi:hypothetical protein